MFYLSGRAVVLFEQVGGQLIGGLECEKETALVFLEL